MSDTQNTAIEQSDDRCCSFIDGNNVINICSPGNTVYIGRPPGCRCHQLDCEDTDATVELPAED